MDNLILLREFCAAKCTESNVRMQGMPTDSERFNGTAFAHEQGRADAYKLVYNLLVEVIDSERT